MLMSIFKAFKKLNNFFINFCLYIKMTNNYYQKHKIRLRKESRKKYQNFSEKGKNKNQKKARE